MSSSALTCTLVLADQSCHPPYATWFHNHLDRIRCANPASGVHDYAASKGALASLVQTLGISLASKGNRVNGVAPGIMYTLLLSTGRLTTEALNAFARSMPPRRPAHSLWNLHLRMSISRK